MIGHVLLVATSPLPKKRRNDFQEQDSIEVTWAPTWEQEELLNERKSLERRVSEYESQVQAPKDISHDNLERQGFDLHPDPVNTWKTAHGDMIRKKLFLICSSLSQNWIFN